MGFAVVLRFDVETTVFGTILKGLMVGQEFGDL